MALNRYGIQSLDSSFSWEKQPLLPSFSATDIWWHSSNIPVLKADYAHDLHGGLHLGNLAQVTQRRIGYLHGFRFRHLPKFRKIRDRGGNWFRPCQRARWDGFEAVRYLNRYEGYSFMPPVDVGQSDSEFFKSAKGEAQWSVIVLTSGLVVPISPSERDKALHCALNNDKTPCILKRRIDLMSYHGFVDISQGSSNEIFHSSPKTKDEITTSLALS